MGLFGKQLEEAIKSSGEDIEMLIEGILASESTTQFFAGDGIGKSTLILQAELESGANVPVYGEFELKRPLKVLHIQTERPPREAYQRMIMMMQKIPVNLDNFYFEATLQGYDLAVHSDRVAIIEKLKKIKDEFGPIDWTHIDPIYAWTSADLSTSSGTGYVNDMIRKIQKDICKTVSYNHHPNRGIKDRETGARIGEDMYGNRFLSANCTGVFHIKSNPGGNGTFWKKEKDSYSCLTSKFNLSYDSQYYMSYVDSEKTFANKAERILSFIKVCKAKNKLFSFEDLMAENEVCTRYARAQVSAHMKIGNLIVTNPNDNKHLYKSNIG